MTKIVFNTSPEEKDFVTIEDTEYVLDDDKNALDSDGNVFKTKEELEELSKADDDVKDKQDDDTVDDADTDSDDNSDSSDTDTDDSTDDDTADEDVAEVEIENEEGEAVKYKLDSDGNALDDKGEVAYTKEELSSFEEEDEKAVFKTADLIAKANIPILDESGSEIEYGDTDDDKASYVTDVYSKGQHDGVDAFIKSNPEMERFYNHLRIHGTGEDYNTSVDFSKIELDETNTEQLTTIIETARKKRGDSSEQIKRYVNSITNADKDNVELHKEAQLEKEYLIKVDKAQLDQEQVQIRDNNLAQQRKEDLYWGVGYDTNKDQIVNLNVDESVYGIISNGTLTTGKGETFKIPERIKVKNGKKVDIYDRDGFFSYLREPKTFVIDGQRYNIPQYRYDLGVENSRRTTGDDVFDAFKLFVKYDNSQLIAENVKAAKVKEIKRLKIKKGSGGKTVKTQDTTKPTKIVFKKPSK